MIDLIAVEILARSLQPTMTQAHVATAYACFVRETARQGIPQPLMLAVLQTEGGKVGQANRNRNGSMDMGPMQINTVQLERLADVTGRHEREISSLLTHDACSNLAVGAWILRDSINRSGETWKGVARYHSNNPKYGTPYAWRVYRNLQSIEGRIRHALPSSDTTRKSN